MLGKLCLKYCMQNFYDVIIVLYVFVCRKIISKHNMLHFLHASAVIKIYSCDCVFLLFSPLSKVLPLYCAQGCRVTLRRSSVASQIPDKG